MPARKPQREEKSLLFRAAVSDALPLATDRVHHEPRRPPPQPIQHQRDEAAALAESLLDGGCIDAFLEGGDDASFLRAGLPRKVLRDLRRGRWVVQAHLDLHGATRHEAHALVADFLAQAASAGQRCLRIVHGKGNGSPGREPVLKRLVQSWLIRRREVLAFVQARPVDGGGGALLVLLRAPR